MPELPGLPKAGALERRITGDGSPSFFSPTFHEAFHSQAGARQEAEQKFVQPAQLRDTLRARPQHEMVGIAQHDIRAQRPHLFGIHGLDGRRRAHGHEGGGADFPTGHGDHARARRAIGPLEGEAKLFGHGMIHWKGAVRAS